AGPNPFLQSLWWLLPDGGTTSDLYGDVAPPLFAFDGGVLLAQPTPAGAGWGLAFSRPMTVRGPPIAQLGRLDNASGMLDPVIFDQRVYFGSGSAADPGTPPQLWTSDGTAP